MSKILLTLSDDILEAVDNECKIRHVDRTEFIRHCIRAILFDSSNTTAQEFRKTSPSSTLSKSEQLIRDAQEAYDLYEQEKKNAAQKAPDPEGKTEDEFTISALPVLMCRYCKIRKECNKVVYSDPDGNDEEYSVCPADMNKLDAHQKSNGGTIMSINGAELL